MIGIVQEAILRTYSFQRAAIGLERGGEHRRLRGKFQIGASDGRKSYQVLHVVIPRPGIARVETVDKQFRANVAQHIPGHLLVIDQPHRLAFPAVFHASRDLLDQPHTDPAVELDLGIARKFERISLERVVMQSGKDERQTKPHDIVQEHDAGAPSFGRQHDETSELARRQFNQREVTKRLTAARSCPQQFHSQVDS